MNIEELKRSILEQNKGEKKSMYNQSEIINSFAPDLRKHEAKEYGGFMLVIPWQLQFPFNPINPDDTSYSKDKYYKAECSSETMITILKEAMNLDESGKLKEFYCAFGGIKKDEYDTTDTSKMTSQDKKIFSQFKHAAQLSDRTQTIRTSNSGKYGTERVSPLKIKGDDIVDEGKILHEAIKFEREIKAEKIAAYMLNKNKSKLTQDQKNDLEALRKSTQIGFPRLSGILMSYEFEFDTETEKLTGVNPKLALGTYLTYMNCGVDILKKIEGRRGKKSDKYMNYAIVKMTYQDSTGPKSPELNLASSRQFLEDLDLDLDPRFHLMDKKMEIRELDNMNDEDVYTEDELKRIEELTRQFDDITRTAIDEGLGGAWEKAARKNVWKFKHFTDDESLEYCSPMLIEYKPYITQKMYDKYNSLFMKVDMKLALELKAAAASGTLYQSKIGVQDAIGIENSDGTIEAEAVEEELKKLDELNKAGLNNYDNKTDVDVATKSVNDLLNESV